MRYIDQRRVWWRQVTLGGSRRNNKAADRPGWALGLQRCSGQTPGCTLCLLGDGGVNPALPLWRAKGTQVLALAAARSCARSTRFMPRSAA